MNILDFVTSYKKSILIFTSIDMKIFDYLEKPIHKRELSKLLLLNIQKLDVFLEALYSLGLLHKRENGYFQNTENTNKYLVSHSKSFLGDLIRLEQHIYTNMVTDNNLYRSLKVDYEIGKEMIDEKFSEYYQNVIYQKIQYLKLVKIYKMMKGIPSDTYLTNNIPINIINTYKRHTNQKISITNIEEMLVNKCSNCNIILHNLIHYLDEFKLKRLLSNCESNVNIIIIDFFCDHLEEQSMSNRKVELLLDWVTHGGINHLYHSEISELFGEYNFKDFYSLKDKENGSTIIFRKN